MTSCLYQYGIRATRVMEEAFRSKGNKTLHLMILCWDPESDNVISIRHKFCKPFQYSVDHSILLSIPHVLSLALCLCLSREQNLLFETNAHLEDARIHMLTLTKFHTNCTINENDKAMAISCHCQCWQKHFSGHYSTPELIKEGDHI